MTSPVALVTGGGSGIGRATAAALAADGARVTIVGRDRDALRAVADEHGLEPIVCDVRVLADTRRAVAATLERFGRLDVLVNSAGILRFGALGELSADEIEEIYRTNVIGAALMVEAAACALRTSRGRVVNVSSTYASRAVPREAHYAASKAALDALTRSWALELAPSGVRVNAVAPGPTATDILAHSGLDVAQQRAMADRSSGRIPMGRLAAPDEVGRWIALFCLEPTLFTTGQVLVLDGGLSMV